MSEFSRSFDASRLSAAAVTLIANGAECAALATRLALIAIRSLTAEVTLAADGQAVRATGRLRAEVVQSCAVSGEDLPVTVDSAVNLRFVPPGAAPGEDQEQVFDPDESDEVDMAGGRFDLGEALAQSLALALDPYAAGPGADRARHRAGLIDGAAAGPFAALAGLNTPARRTSRQGEESG